MDDGTFGEAIHQLLRELGWSHGELTPSLVYQALAQVRHLRKEAAEAERLRTTKTTCRGSVHVMREGYDNRCHCGAVIYRR